MGIPIDWDFLARAIQGAAETYASSLMRERERKKEEEYQVRAEERQKKRQIELAKIQDQLERETAQWKADLEARYNAFENDPFYAMMYMNAVQNPQNIQNQVPLLATQALRMKLGKGEILSDDDLKILGQLPPSIQNRLLDMNRLNVKSKEQLELGKLQAESLVEYRKGEQAIEKEKMKEAQAIEKEKMRFAEEQKEMDRLQKLEGIWQGRIANIQEKRTKILENKEYSELLGLKSVYGKDFEKRFPEKAAQLRKLEEQLASYDAQEQELYKKLETLYSTPTTTPIRMPEKKSDLPEGLTEQDIQDIIEEGKRRGINLTREGAIALYKSKVKK